MTSTTSTKVAINKAIKKSIAIGTICIAALTSSLPLTHPVFAQYGLGLSKSSGTGGATRGDLPQLTILVPEDGAKTLASRPTFYWYVAPQSVSKDSSTDPQTESAKSSFKLTFFLRDGNERSSKAVFVAEGKAEDTGLYKFTLPEDAPELVKGKVQRLQIRWEANEGGSQVDVNAPILLDANPVVVKLIASAKNDLEKGRIYAKNAYWYDAVDAYTSWLSQNPKDALALAERSNLMKAGLNGNSAFMKTEKDAMGKLVLSKELDAVKFANFLTKIDENTSAKTIVLQPKIVTK